MQIVLLMPHVFRALTLGKVRLCAQIPATRATETISPLRWIIAFSALRGTTLLVQARPPQTATTLDGQLQAIQHPELLKLRTRVSRTCNQFQRYLFHRFGKMVPPPEKNFSQPDFAFVVMNDSLSSISNTACFLPSA
jgi:hypothetical protein